MVAICSYLASIKNTVMDKIVIGKNVRAAMGEASNFSMNNMHVTACTRHVARRIVITYSPHRISLAV